MELGQRPLGIHRQTDLSSGSDTRIITRGTFRHSQALICGAWVRNNTQEI